MNGITLSTAQADEVLGTVLDLGAALADHGHKFTRKERAAFAKSIRILTGVKPSRRARRAVRAKAAL